MAHRDFVEYRCIVCGLDKLPGPHCPDCNTSNSVRMHIPEEPDTAPLLEKRQYSEEELESLGKDIGTPFSKSAMIRQYLQKNIKPGFAVAARDVVNEFWQKGQLKLFPSYRHAAVRVRNVAGQMNWTIKSEGGITFLIRPREDLEGYDPETRNAI